MESNNYQGLPPINSADKPKKHNAWIYLAIILLLLTTNIILFTKNRKADKEIISTNEQLTENKIENENLQIQYSAALARLDELTGKNAALDKIITDKDSEIAKMKERIESIIKNKNATAAELGEAKELIRKMNGRISNYEQEIANLKQENATVTLERDQAMEKGKVLEEANTQLEEKVTLGKVLSASNIFITPIELRKGGEKEVTTSRARRVDILRVKFDINENRLTESGPQEFQIRIINPEGKLLSNAALGSGSFKMKDVELPQYYTISRSVNLKHQEPLKNVTIDWQQTANYPKGSYTIEIYNQGYLIGKTATELR